MDRPARPNGRAGPEGVILSQLAPGIRHTSPYLHHDGRDSDARASALGRVSHGGLSEPLAG